jgi:DNA mismatch repair protein MutL
MAEIRLLAPDVAERIAAGEVIDRPASAVKELVENALDAGATAIRVEARGGGLRLIRVADDGCGIPGDQLELAFLRHATSKLRDLAGLEQVRTLGFRGEALASIAAVAEVAIVSATDDGAGSRCLFRAGRPLEHVGAARERGTTITVVDLFSLLPARLKFMRGARSEAATIGALLRRFALARPDVRYTLLLEGRVQFRHDGGGLTEALAAVFGDTVARGLMPVEAAVGESVRIGGMIGDRGATRGSRSGLALYVNGRAVRARPLLEAIEAGYRPFLPSGRHAVGAIFLDLPPEDVDVNIHPAKLDVRLRDESAVCAALTTAVRAAYGRHPVGIAGVQPLALAGAQPRLRGLSRLSRVAEERQGWGGAAPREGGSPLPPLRLVGQVENALLVAEGSAGIYLIDQHRAHERVIFDNLGSADGRQALIEPALIELSPAESARLTARLEALDGLGFACEQFGASRFIVRAVPSGDELSGLGGALADLLHDAAADAENWRERLLATISCRAAVRKGRPLTPAQTRDLLDRLAAAHSPAVCPHGSPVILHLSDGFLARQFDWG